MIRFTIPGKPQGKGRPRFTRSGRTYTDAKTLGYEKAVAFACRVGMGDLAAFVGPVEVQMKVRLVPAVSLAKKVRADMLNGHTFPIKNGDVDNYAKSVLDGMNGIAYADDKQVCRLTVEKVYAKEAGVDVAIFPLPCNVADIAAHERKA